MNISPPLDSAASRNHVFPHMSVEYSRSPSSQVLVEIVCREPEGTEALVAFSRVAGEHATFVRGPSGVRSFGEHAARYDPVNFFGEGKNGKLDST